MLRLYTIAKELNPGELLTGSIYPPKFSRLSVRGYNGLSYLISKYYIALPSSENFGGLIAFVCLT